MPFLVDGDNLLGTWGRPRSDMEKGTLAAELGRFARSAGRKLTVVFDGPPPVAGAERPGVVYSGAGRDADGVILERLRGEKNPRGWIVVTDDRSLADQSRWLGATHERCAAFRERLRGAGEDEKPEHEGDVDYWLAQFGEIDD